MQLQALNWIDFIIIGLITFSSLISLIRGFVREALSLASWIIAFWIALTFSSHLAHWLHPYIHNTPIRTGLAFVALFAGALIVGAIVNSFITSVVEKTGLSGTDRLLGVVFGFGRGILLIAVILLILQISTLPRQPIWLHSQLIPQFRPVERWLSQYLPQDIRRDLNHQQQSTTRYSSA